MKFIARLFLLGAAFYLVVATVYGFMTSWLEPAGVAAIYLTGGLSLLIGGYAVLVSRRSDGLPEDDPLGEISQGMGEQGLFAPNSWWPMPLALAAAVMFAGFAVGWWLFLIGAGIGVVALVGWVFEFYRGGYAH